MPFTRHPMPVAMPPAAASPEVTSQLSSVVQVHAVTLLRTGGFRGTATSVFVGAGFPVGDTNLSVSSPFLETQQQAGLQLVFVWPVVASSRQLRSSPAPDRSHCAEAPGTPDPQHCPYQPHWLLGSYFASLDFSGCYSWVVCSCG